MLLVVQDGFLELAKWDWRWGVVCVWCGGGGGLLDHLTAPLALPAAFPKFFLTCKLQVTCLERSREIMFMLLHVIMNPVASSSAKPIVFVNHCHKMASAFDCVYGSMPDVAPGSISCPSCNGVSCYDLLDAQ